MKRLIICLYSLLLMAILASCKTKENSFVLVEGGYFKNSNSNFYDSDIKVNDFYIGVKEVTQKEWLEIMDYNPSSNQGDNLPVDTVTWYECIEYCNKRSIKEGYTPYYSIDLYNKDPENISPYDDTEWTVTTNEEANGYRLLTTIEWEYAASGGQLSKGYKYSGSDDLEEVGWYFRNSGDEFIEADWNWGIIESNHNKTKEAGMKTKNELGIYDMSGNVREWCFDWYVDEVNEKGMVRSCRGGGWMGDSRACEISYQGKFEANGFGADQGLRIGRNAK